MRTVFVDATPTLAAAMGSAIHSGSVEVSVNVDPDVKVDELPALLAGAEVAMIDHSYFPTHIARQCQDLRHVVFMGTGAASYMDIGELAELGIQVHLIRNYGDTAVAECAIGLMFAAAKSFGVMDRGVRSGQWLRTNGVQLTGKTFGILGFGSIAAEAARMALGLGMKVVAWNRSPRSHPGVTFTDLDVVLAASDVVSLHLLFSEETKGLINRERLARFKPGAILVNTARGALIDEMALVDALREGRIGAAGLDVYAVEPLPPDHPFVGIPNLVLSAHSAFRTPDATDNLVRAALDHCSRILAEKTSHHDR